MKIKNAYTRKEISEMYGMHLTTLKRRLYTFWGAGAEEENEAVRLFLNDRRKVFRKDFEIIKKILKKAYGFEPLEEKVDK